MVRRLGDTGRTALVWYAVLILLPAIVFGGLLWKQLLDQHLERRSQVPEHVADNAGRLASALRDEFSKLLSFEETRPFYEYAEVDFFAPSTAPGENFELSAVLTPTLLLETPGIRAWFQWDFIAFGDVPPTVIAPQPRGLTAEEAEEHTRWRMDFEEFIEDVLIDSLVGTPERIATEIHLSDLMDAEWSTLVNTGTNLVALNTSLERDVACIEQNLGTLSQQVGRMHTTEVYYSPMEVRLLRDQHGELHLLAERKVVIAEMDDKFGDFDCFTPLQRQQWFIQGLDLDPEYWLERLPRHLAAQVLGTEVTLHGVGTPTRAEEDDEGIESATLDLWDVYDADLMTRDLEGTGTVTMTSSVTALESDFRTQLTWLIGVTTAMIASLALGTRFLVRSVRVSEAQTQRTENFVAAVTHELRTPIAAIKMYGEMLRDGWARDEAKQQDYMQRIVHESDRLDSLVDRVLAKRMLAERAPRPVPGDLSAEVAGHREDLKNAGGANAQDLEFVLADGLPKVLVNDEGLREIVVNLVENARKYAPVPEGGEPIRIETRISRRGRVLLEVSDRGPGIPESERSRIFDPFYRIGDEHTRSTKGTGLGLHLVQLQARAMRGKVSARPREGGGTTFRVSFKTAKA